MKHINVLKQINKLELEVTSSVHTWECGGVQYTENMHKVQRGNIELHWNSRIDGSAFNVMLYDNTDLNDASCDYAGKTTHIHKVTRIADMFKVYEATAGSAAFKLAGNLMGLNKI